MIGAIVLAAGKSERMGRTKALLEFGGMTFLGRILNAIAQSEAGPTVVVLGHDRENIERSIQTPGAVFNPKYEEGMTTSFQTGIRALPPSVDGALLCLVDHPMPAAQTLNALIRNFQPGHIALPTFASRRGHPALFSRAALDEVLALPASAGANTIVWKFADRIVEVPVGDSGILIDIDTPEDYRRLCESQKAGAQ